MIAAERKSAIANDPTPVALVLLTSVEVSDTPPPPEISIPKVLDDEWYVIELPLPTKLSVEMPTFCATTMPAD